MLKRQWEHIQLNSYADWLNIKDGIQTLSPQICGFDTETTGLHIKLDKPFLLQFGFLHPTNPNKGFTFLIDFRTTEGWKDIAEEWFSIASKAQLNLACNIKFDLHMLENVGINIRDDNLAELQAYIRYACDALHVKEGGAPLSLKDFTARYIDPDAKYHENLLNAEKSKQVKTYNLLLKNRLQVLGEPPKKYNAKSYTLKVIDTMFKDPLFELDDLPEDVRKVYLEWKQNDLPNYLQEKVTSLVEKDFIRYDTLDKRILHKYAHLDIVYLLESYEKLIPILKYRHNEEAVRLENSLILPFLDMENTGLLADKEYLEESRKRVKGYTLKLRQRFYELAGCEIAVGQHALIQSVLNNKFNLNVNTTNSDELEILTGTLKRENPESPAIEFIQILSELRTLEKWYATYILRFQKDLIKTDRLYTQINSEGTISGRVTSDFQQFPKNAIKDSEGNELFHPRKMVLVPPNCRSLLYLDYSQIELRFQAMYTILVGHPDMNMCRAYMPYKCHKSDGTPFDYNNIEHIKNWNAEWFLDEDNTKWTPTDIHGATTLAAFKSIGLTKDDPRFHSLRYVGKRVDFAKNYGASLIRIMAMFPEYSKEQCVEIDGAYYEAFPGVKTYHTYCFNRAQAFPYTTNLFGVRYYGANGHKLRNLLVQGSAAHFLKYRIRAIWEFLRDNGYKTRMQLQIHDELVFEENKEDPDLAKRIQEIMQDWDDALIPIIAEAERTTTNWAEKEEVEL